MASSRRKRIGIRNEDELAVAVNEIVNDNDSYTDNFLKLSSSEERESQSANECNISIPGPGGRQIDATPTAGFSMNDHQPRIPPFIGKPGV
jgi:hypothetical protein